MNKTRLSIILSSIIIVLPIFFGLAFWNRLPDPMPTHWGMDGTVDGWSSRPFAVFFLPLLVLLLHLLCCLGTRKDSKNKNQNKKLLDLVVWITPSISILGNGIMYGVVLGKEIDLPFIMSLFLGLVFVVVGNYLPKCQQNRTIGIRIKWTLENEANWNATHRFAGKLWVAGGLAAIGSAFLPSRSFILILVLLAILTLLPVARSYWFHKRHE